MGRDHRPRLGGCHQGDDVNGTRELLKKDLVPQSDQHWARLILGGLAVAAACYKYVTHSGAWTRDDIIAAALFLLGGLGVVFTGSVVALLKAVPVPWKRNGNGGSA